MLFSSGTFLFLFLPVSLIGYQLLSGKGRQATLLWLALTSLFFYGYWNPAYLLLLCGSILMNFLFSRMLGTEKSEDQQDRWLATAIVANLLLLVYYKYLFPFLNFLHAHRLLLRSFHEVMLPLGISFFTFTQIAYLIDVRQQIAKRQGILSYSVFVTFFPHLIAGPVIHPREMMPQLEARRLHGLRADDLSLGLSWFVLGLAKKVLVADPISPLADVLFAHPASAGFLTSWLGALAYAMQLYFDFSGYSDMALGIARMFSIQFPINFNSPYKSQGIIEFWQRWHMTLSRYLNEYLYTPIVRWVTGRRLEAGKKVSRKATATLEGFASMVLTPVMTTMFIAGIWHGAGLQFLIFGVLHGTFITVNHAWRILTPQGNRLHRAIPAPVMIVLSFVCVLISFVFFRAANTTDAFYILGTMSGAHNRSLSFADFPYLAEIPTSSKFLMHLPSAALAIALCLLIVWGMPNTQQILGQTSGEEPREPSLLPRLLWKPTLWWSFGLTGLLCMAILMLNASARFLYFQF